MVVAVFFMSSVLIVFLFLLNQIRMTGISFFTTISWYLLALIIYFALSDYLKEWTAQAEGLNLGLLGIITSSLILHIYQSQGKKR